MPTNISEKINTQRTENGHFKYKKNGGEHKRTPQVESPLRTLMFYNLPFQAPHRVVATLTNPAY